MLVNFKVFGTILLLFGISYCNLVYFIAIWYILLSFWYIFPVLAYFPRFGIFSPFWYIFAVLVYFPRFGTILYQENLAALKGSQFNEKHLSGKTTQKYSHFWGSLNIISGTIFYDLRFYTTATIGTLWPYSITQTLQEETMPVDH
jgi:hypothetical protein